MQSFRNPWWLFVINIIPVSIFGWIFYGTYQLIESILSADNISHWIRFGTALGTLWSIHIAYTVTMILKRKKLDYRYAVTTLVIYIAFLYCYVIFYYDMIPSNIPTWLLSENRMLYAGTFIMPTLIHSLIILVSGNITNLDKKKVWTNLAFVAIIPVGWFLFFQTIVPLWRGSSSDFGWHAMIVFIIATTVAFLFFFVRSIYILSIKKSEVFKRYSLLWKIILAVAFPLAGLFVNNEMFFEFIFGNFSNPWFYILAALNGLAVCLPEYNFKYYRLFLFTLRSITYTYILYFFLVFLPYLPLSALAIACFGLGFLMLTPLILMIFQTNMLVKDVKFLCTCFSKKQVIGLFAGSVMVIPIIVSVSYVSDRNILHRALRYVYQPDYENNTEAVIDTPSLSRIVRYIRSTKERDWEFNRQIPFLSSFYNNIVLDNLTLSDSKLDMLERVFTGNTSFTEIPVTRFVSTNSGKDVFINKVNVTSRFDDVEKAWVSLVDLDITNNSSWQREYTTSFELPDGAWINDYYLWIGDEKVNGLLSEKKAATWIYQQVTSYRKDPGLLYYIGGNKIGFKVFPFNGSETRKTGFQIIHKEPFDLHLDGRTISLGENKSPGSAFPVASEDGNARYFSREFKNTLNTVVRKPYYNFVIDCSGNGKQVGEFVSRIKWFLVNENVQSTTARYTLAGAYTLSCRDYQEFLSATKTCECGGGFFLERAIQKILFDAWRNQENAYPVIVVVTDSIANAVIADNFSDFKTAYPESDYFYELNPSGHLQTHSLTNNPIAVVNEDSQDYSVLAWPDEHHPEIYLRNDDQPTVTLLPDRKQSDRIIAKEGSWSAGLMLQGQWLSNVFYPNKENWMTLVEESFEKHIMTPFTSFIVLENEAQRTALLKKQQDILKASQTLDAGEEIQMSEPGLIILLILSLGAWRTKKYILRSTPENNQPVVDSTK